MAFGGSLRHRLGAESRADHQGRLINMQVHWVEGPVVQFLTTIEQELVAR